MQKRPSSRSTGSLADQLPQIRKPATLNDSPEVKFNRKMERLAVSLFLLLCVVMATLVSLASMGRIQFVPAPRNPSEIKKKKLKELLALRGGLRGIPDAFLADTQVQSHFISNPISTRMPTSTMEQPIRNRKQESLFEIVPDGNQVIQTWSPLPALPGEFMSMHDTSNDVPKDTTPRLRHGYHRSRSHRTLIIKHKDVVDITPPHTDLSSQNTIPLVSIITPTSSNREKFTRNVLRNYQRQRHQRVELLVMDDGGSPSEFWLRVAELDPNVRYFHARMYVSLGFKRNQLVREAKGEVVAQMDDDDYYGEAYVDRMLEQLIHHDADLIKLGSWSQYAGRYKDDILFGHFLSSNTIDRNFRKNVRWGFGFSYFFRRSCGALASFPGESFGEDYDWVSRLRAHGAKIFMLDTPPEPDMVIKIEHGNNTSMALGLKASVLNSEMENRVRKHIQETLMIATPPAGDCIVDIDKDAFGNDVELGGMSVAVGNIEQCCAMCRLDEKCFAFSYSDHYCWKKSEQALFDVRPKRNVAFGRLVRARIDI